MVDIIYFVICLIGFAVVCFGAGVEFAAWVYHKEKRYKK